MIFLFFKNDRPDHLSVIQLINRLSDLYKFHATSFFLALLSAPTLASQNDTNIHTNTKRTASDQIYTQGETKPVVVYVDNVPSQSSNSPDYALKNFYSNTNKPLALVSVQQPIQVFEQDNPKQVAAQQVSYEFQKTPTNAVSNVHVQQLFQPDDYDDNGGNQPLLAHPQAPGYVTAAETVVSPVQHNTFTNHGVQQPTNNQPSHFNHHPNNQFNPQPFNHQPNHFQPNQFNSQPNQFHHQQSQFSLQPNVLYHNQRTGPGKYLYLNGKIVYQPNHNQNTGNGNLQPHGTRVHPVNLVAYNQFGQAPPPHHGVSLNHNNPALIHNQQKVPAVNFGNRHPPAQPNHVGVRPRLFPPANNPPITYNRFHHQVPHQKLQMERITQPSAQPPVRNEEDQNEETNEDDDDDEEGAPTENEEDDEEAAAEDADDEEDRERPNYDFHKEDDHAPDADSRGFHFEKYHYDDDHYNGRFKRRHKFGNREDEDNEKEQKKRSSKSPSKSKNKKNHKAKKTSSHPKYHPDHYDDDSGFKFSEGFTALSKYESPPSGKQSKSKKRPKGQYYKKTKYHKKNGKPKVETIEGRYSELAPVTHKHKFYKEKWFVTKSTDGPGTVDKV